jgi:putative glutamine amidotransferase
MSYAENLLKDCYNTLDLAWDRRERGVDADYLMRLPLNKVYYVPGGFDIHPSLYEQEIMEGTQLGPAWPEATLEEAIIVRYLVEIGHPTIAICRGHQLVHGATGGELVQDVFRDLGYAVHEKHYCETRAPLLNGVTKGLLSTVRGPLCDYVEINHTHHQAVVRVGNGFRNVAMTPDGIIEAAEHEDKPILTMQFHPEYAERAAHPWVDWYIPLLLNYLEGFLPGGDE